MGRNCLAKRFLEHEVTFTFRCKTFNGRCKRTKRCLAFGCSTRRIREAKEDKRAKTTVKKYLAQVICKTSIEELKYLAKASIKGTIIEADALSITAFMSET